MCSQERTDRGALTRAFQPPELRDDVQGSHWPGFVKAPEWPHTLQTTRTTRGGSSAGLAGHGRACLGGAGGWEPGSGGTCPFLG